MKSKSRKLRMFILLGFCSVVAISGAVAGKFYYGSPAIRELADNWLKPSNLATTIKAGDPLAIYNPSQQFPGVHSMNLLIMGCDADYYPGKPIPIPTSNGRSDATMLCHVNFDTNQIDIVSIPRDSASRIPGHRGISKINAAHEWGGNQLSDEVVANDYGITPDYTVAAHFSSFQKIVDAVGGVNLFVDKPLNYDDNWADLHIHLKPGFQHLNGYQAMGFVRIRHCDSDIIREERQQEFLEALRKQLESPTNFLALPAVLNAVTDNLQSNMTDEQMLSLLHWATTVPKANIHLNILPVTQGKSFVYTDVNRASKMIADVFFHGDVNQVHLNVVTLRQMDARRAGRRMMSRAVSHSTGYRTHLTPVKDNTPINVIHSVIGGV